MAKTLSQLADEIFKEAQADGEEVTKEEALEMARMELGAKEIKRYEHSEKAEKKVRKPRERKIDEEKRAILIEVGYALEKMGVEVTAIKTETEIKFGFNGNDYTLKLTKHRPKR